MVIIGIDPGMSGGIACATSEKVVLLRKMPETEADIAEFFSPFAFRMPHKIHAYIEKVHSMPKQGVSSTFKFGMNYGFLKACLFAFKIPFTPISPQTWQKLMGCRSGGDKNVTKSRAQELFPNFKVTHATADALLICEYGRRELAKRILQSPKRITEARIVLKEGGGD